ncbi:remorin-like [Lotus japonicus]|uniref:remorin-like n=1 Tax=Lotus japonicus TaxID=34305 RepID=UPI002590AB09|nr:remorin-like [Lotus japonicus]
MGEEETKHCDQCGASASASASEATVLSQLRLSEVLKLKESQNAESSNSTLTITRQGSTTNPSYPLDQDLDAETDNINTSIDRDAVLARVESQKRLALIKAWEENEKTKVDNKAYKLQCAVDMWEKTKKASTQAKIKKIEENMDRKKADYVEIMQNKIAETHRLADEKKALIEAQKGEEVLKVEETAAKFRTRGYVPKKFLSCFNFSF